MIPLVKMLTEQVRKADAQAARMQAVAEVAEGAAAVCPTFRSVRNVGFHKTMGE